MPERVEKVPRASVIDGGVEVVQKPPLPTLNSGLEPVFETVVIQILGLEGLEETTQKRLVGYKQKDV